VEDEDESEWGMDDDAVWDEMLDGVEDALNDFDDDDDDDDDDDESIRIINV